MKGSGLGLAITREYALAQGGRIEVLDRDDGRRGADFRLRLPLAAGAQSAVEAPAAPPTAHDGSASVTMSEGR